jgi:hypothetical protein
MPECALASRLQQDIWQQVQQLHDTQTAPFQLLVSDYTGCLQRKRDLEVRLNRISSSSSKQGPHCCHTLILVAPLSSTAESVIPYTSRGMVWHVLTPKPKFHATVLPLPFPAGACGCAGAREG